MQEALILATKIEFLGIQSTALEMKNKNSFIRESFVPIRQIICLETCLKKSSFTHLSKMELLLCHLTFYQVKQQKRDT